MLFKSSPPPKQWTGTYKVVETEKFRFSLRLRADNDKLNEAEKAFLLSIIEDSAKSMATTQEIERISS